MNYLSSTFLALADDAVDDDKKSGLPGDDLGDTGEDPLYEEDEPEEFGEGGPGGPEKLDEGEDS